ncbi:unnamed protein product [Rotaria sp. Silwood2]|nr:unnamed protein product [Rotaria sp. Silwood2]CAF4308801.1 unnamed protein product [Rotaria sp. Silwood2]
MKNKEIVLFAADANFFCFYIQLTGQCERSIVVTRSSFPFATRRNAITDDYDISSEMLGVGVNGKVFKCTHRRTRQKGAVKACDIWSMGVIMYILLCGYPPFFPKGDQQLSIGMKSRIKTGNYQFPDDEWRNISEESKSIIQRMLTVDPAKRITIGEILTSTWLTELTSERPIDMTVLQDVETLQELEVAVASANDIQRRTDDDFDIRISGPEASRNVKRAAKRKQQITVTGQAHHIANNKFEYYHDKSSANIIK